MRYTQHTHIRTHTDTQTDTRRHTQTHADTHRHPHSHRHIECHVEVHISIYLYVFVCVSDCVRVRAWRRVHILSLSEREFVLGVLRARRCHLRAGFQQCKSFVEMGTVRCCPL